MNLKTPDWVNELRASLAREFGDAPRIAALATVDGEGRPQARSIVMRELSRDGSIWFVTDARSAKIIELTVHAEVHVLLWLPSLRVQYRLSGKARREVEIEAVRATWDRLSQASREMFFWEVPGAQLGESATAQANPPTDVPDNFAVYRVVVHKAEFLSLNERPHLRWIACESNGWQCQKITP